MLHQLLEHLHHHNQALLEPQTLEQQLGAVEEAALAVHLRFVPEQAHLRQRPRRAETVQFTEAVAEQVHHLRVPQTAALHKALLERVALARQIAEAAVALVAHSRLLLALEPQQLEQTPQVQAVQEPMAS